jgi:leader peptidase (prepilin peptidase)/N-methyltransferase
MAYMVATLSSEWGLQAFFHLIFLTILLLITVIDLEHKLILFVVIVPSCLIAVLASVLVPSSPPDLGDALGGGLAGFFVFFLMFLGGLGFSRLIHTDEIAFGFGDVMLGTLSGLILGWQALIFALFLTIFLGAGGAILYLGSRMILHNRYSWFTAIPYGPYIALSTVLVMLWREEIRALIW